MQTTNQVKKQKEILKFISYSLDFNNVLNFNEDEYTYTIKIDKMIYAQQFFYIKKKLKCDIMILAIDNIIYLTIYK